MLDFLLNNKEWLFSGVGVVIIMGLLSLIFKFIRIMRRASSGHQAHEQAASQAVNVPVMTFDTTTDYLPKPDPADMQKHFESLPPFQRNGSEKNYIGLRIKWNVTLSFVDSKTGGVVELACKFEGYPRYVNIRTTLDEYPQIKVAEKGKRITVYGTIKDFDVSGPVVVPHKLIFKE